MAKKDDTPTPEDLGIVKTDITEEVESESQIETQTEAPAGPAPKRRGRPPGSGSGNAKTASDRPKKSNARKAESVEALAQQLMGLHQLAFMATQLPECIINPTEANMLATGLNAVAEEYGLLLTGKTGAAIQLFGALGIVYGPRLLNLKKRMNEQKAKEKAERDMTIEAGQVVPMSGHAAFN